MQSFDHLITTRPHEVRQLLISDLHLSPDEPALVQAFLLFLFLVSSTYPTYSTVTKSHMTMTNIPNLVIFSWSFGPISWVYMSEIMPMQIRGRGNAFATGIGNWLVSTLFAQVSPIALGAVGWRYYFVFVAFNIVVTMPTIWFIFPETNKMSLEEIDLLFGERALGTLPDHLNEKEMDAAIRTGSVTGDMSEKGAAAVTAEHAA